MNKIKELKVELYGRVQGVQFRHFVKTSADKLGLKGFVKNKEDGSLVAVAQGEEEKLRNFLAVVEIGPQLAKVEGVSYFWSDIGERYNEFKIEKDKGFIKDQGSSFFNLGKKLLNIKNKIPLHVAIIPDGNRRWAVKNGFNESFGHVKAGAYENFKGLFVRARELGVKNITFWAFSTENWKRSQSEKKILFDIFSEHIKKCEDDFIKERIRFRHLGRKDRLPKEIIREIEKLEKLTKEFSDFNVQLCLDYGGRDEIARAVNKILKSGLQEIREEDIERYLDSAGIPDPDLIIRTSGEKRMSGFMPIQSTYAEFYFCEKDFPDFSPRDLEEAIKEFGERRRRFGK